MSDFIDSVNWRDRGVLLSLFAISTSKVPDRELRVTVHAKPVEVRSYVLEDVDMHFCGRSCVEYDIEFSTPPSDINDVLSSWLGAAISAGFNAAWFAFEGTFDFRHVLTADSATDVYAVSDPGGTKVATDRAVRHSVAWSERVASVRERFLKSAGDD